MNWRHSSWLRLRATASQICMAVRWGSVFHRITDWSSPPVARVLPSGLNAIDRTDPVWLTGRAVGAWWVMSQRTAVLSVVVWARLWLSWLNAMPGMSASWVLVIGAH